MKALVTGGCGFIGSHLVGALLEEGWDVDVLDDLSTGQFTNLSIVNPGCTRRLYQRSIQDAALKSGRPTATTNCLLDKLIEEADYVFHLAAVVGVQRVLRYPLKTIESNIQSTALVLEKCARFQKPVIIASSSEVYGNQRGNLPLREDEDLNIGPELRWGYAAAKLVDEFTALAHHKETGLPVVVARLFNTIGPNQVGTYGMVVPRMIERALGGETIQVYDGGNQRRAFTWVYDVTRALIDLVQCENAYGQVVNIGNANDISIADLARLIRETVYKSSTIEAEIEVIPIEDAYGTTFVDIEYRVPNLTKIRDLIGYDPTLNIEQMIQTLVALKTGGKSGTA